MDKENSFIVFNYKSFGSDDKLYMPSYDALQKLMTHQLEITDINNIGLDRVNRKIEVTLAEVNQKYTNSEYKIKKCVMTTCNNSDNLSVTHYIVYKGIFDFKRMDEYLLLNTENIAKQVCNKLNEEVAMRWQS